ncbi:hypothetical protein F5887DRAFT_921016 [Amanita rubescens]|nr:hypothetical protein F5887DRAFT_921016 [Amanita rubescens]
MIYAWCSLRKGTFALREWPRFLQFFHVWLYTTVVTFPIVVTAVFWVVRQRSSRGLTHGATYKCTRSTLLLTNVPPPPWIYLPLNVAILACYLRIAYITSGTQHFYTYNFLDPKKEGGLLAAYIVGIAVCECVAYALVYGVIVLRQKVTRGRGVLDDGARSRVPDEAVDEWQNRNRCFVVGAYQAAFRVDENGDVDLFVAAVGH